MTVCLNPVIQRTVLLQDFSENQVNRSDNYRMDVSGKGINVSRVLQQLGEHCLHITQAGGHFCSLFLELSKVDELNIEAAESFTDIRICTTLINLARCTTTEIVEEGQPVESGTQERIFRIFSDHINEYDSLIISGSKAPGFSDDFHAQLAGKAKDLGKTVILDTRGRDLLNSLACKPDIIKPNYDEFCATFFPDETNPEPAPEQVHRKMLELAENGIVTILTRGSRPLWYTHEGLIHNLTPEPLKPVNTIGCGDAFTAGLACEWHQTASLPAAVAKGMQCARLNAQLIRPGVIR